jgi:peptide deformylase
MTALPITRVGNPVLRQRARPVDRDELASAECQTFIDDLVDSMRAANGAGIAANQVGDDRAICAIEIADNPRYPYKPPWPLTILVNPRFVMLSDDTYRNNEGCLSVPDLRGDLHRAIGAVVQFVDRTGSEVELELRGLTAGTAQHELDHLNGVIFLDRVEDSRTLATWAEFDAHQRPEFETHITRIVKETT